MPDANTKKLIWQGTGSRPVEQNLDKRDRELPKNVIHMLKHFPVNKKNK